MAHCLFDLIFSGVEGDTEEGVPARTSRHPLHIVRVMNEPATQEVMCSSWQSDTDAPPQCLALSTLGTGACVVCMCVCALCVCARVSLRVCARVYMCVGVLVLVLVRCLFVCACVQLLYRDNQACIAEFG